MSDAGDDGSVGGGSGGGNVASSRSSSRSSSSSSSSEHGSRRSSGEGSRGEHSGMHLGGYGGGHGGGGHDALGGHGSHGTSGHHGSSTTPHISTMPVKPSPAPAPAPEKATAEDSKVPDLAKNPQAPAEAPPPFSAYEPQFEEDEDGIITHDPHLNSDGEALYRFLLAQSSTPPKLLLSLVGTHTEQRTRRVASTSANGVTTYRSQSYTVTITDFSTDIDLAANVLPGGTQWTVRDGTAAFRGAMVREVDEAPAVGGGEKGQEGEGEKKGAGDVEKGAPGRKVRRRATDEEEVQAEAWEGERASRGLPPWADQAGEQVQAALQPGAPTLLSSRSTRDWADDYIASRRVLKEFTYTKVIYGWDITALTSALEATIKSTGFPGHVSVSFRTSSTNVVVRPVNKLSRMLDALWVKILLSLVLIYPAIWLWRRFSSSGGGRYEVCGAAYALRRHGEGEKEGEWMKRWEPTVRHVVGNSIKGGEPMLEPVVDGHAALPDAVRALDGYEE